MRWTMLVELLEARRLLAAGELDPTFGDGGAFAMPVDRYDSLRWIGKTPDGKILAAITFSYGHNGKLHLRRFNADGSPDATLGTNGDVLTTSVQHARFFAVSPDG